MKRYSIYNLKLEFSLKFIDDNETSNVLRLNGNISFFIDDTHSINKKRKFLKASFYELIKKIDNRLEIELEKENFVKYKTTL